MIDVVRWIACIPLGIVFGSAILFNYSLVIRTVLARKGARVPSPVPPPVGGLVGALVFVLCPYPGTTPLFWAPLVVDVAVYPLLIVVGLARSRWDAAL